MKMLIKNITKRIGKEFNRKGAKTLSKIFSAPLRLCGSSFIPLRLCVSAVSLSSKLSPRLCASAVLFFLFFQIGAQTTYPIRTYTVLNPPMPYSLSAFASEPGRMQLNVVVDDVALDQYPVKFSLHIQGNGVHLYTKPDLQQQHFMLDGGLTETVTGLDLEPLFNPNNLIFEGYSRNEYQRNGRLPEGVYRIWVDIHDYYRGMKVSQAFPGMAMIYLTRAPRLSFPLNKTEVNPQTEPNIRFSWMGTLPADPEADVYYRLNLWEIMPEGRDPYEVARVSSPIFTDESDDPNFLYDMGMPPLLDGMSYAWQVQAIDRENRARFQNEGYSEVNVFRYGLSCVTPEPRINSVAYNEASISWAAHVATQLYRVFYKKAKDTEWQSEETTMVNHTLKELEDNIDYEIKVVAICGNEESDESRIIRLKTDRNVDYTCGTDNDDFDLSNREPLEELYPFDEFKAADFVIEVTEAEGSNGVFSGKGLALVPYIGMAKFYVTFDNITINSDSRMVDGEVHFVFDEATGMVVGIGAGGDDGDNGDLDVTDDLDDIADEVIEIDGDVKEVKVSDDKVVVVKEDGTTETIKVKKGDKVAVVSNGGQVQVADTGSGRVYSTPKKKSGGKKGSDSVGTASQTRQYGASVSFEAPKNMRFGYDPVGNGENKPDAYFERNKTGDRIAWKSIQAGGTDYIDVIPQGAHADSLRYIRESGLVTPASPQDKGSRLLLTGLGGGDEDILTVAVAKTEQIDSTNTREILTEAGALGLVSYDVITKNVVLVPVNRAQCPQNKVVVQEYLNKLYKGAVVNWNVEIGQPFDFTDYTGESFKTEGSALLSKYTRDMNRLIDAYKKQASNFSKDNYYLFFINEPQTNKLGFMPLTGQFGFIFNFGYNLSTVGHELAHGAFNLRHTFSNKAKYYLQQGSTKNLLDYSNSEELWKYQWDLIHDPQTMLFAWAQEEEEGAFVFGETSLENIVRAVRNVRCAKDNNEETTNLYFSNYSYSIEIKDLVSAFNWAGSDVSDEKIKFYISNDGVIDLDYFEDEFDVKNIQYNESKSQVVIKGKEESLFVEPYDAYSDHKAEIYSFIKTMFDGSVSIKEPTAAEVNGMELDKLRYLSVCQLALMSDDKRKETLRSISEQTAIPAKDEKLVLNLLKTTKSPSAIYSLLSEDQVSFKLFKALNTYHKEFIFLFNWICEASWTDAEKQKAEIIFLGTNDKGVRYQLSEQSWMFDEKEENKIPVWNLEDLGCSNCLSKKFNSSPVAPIKIAYFDGNNRTVSTVLVDYLREQENKEEWTDAMISYLSGVGLSSAGRVLLTKSTPKIVKFLALVEFGKTGIDVAFKDEQLKANLRKANHDWFVDNWTTISISLDVVTFGSEMIVKFATKGDDLSAVMRANGKTKAADEAQRITDEAKAMLDNAGDLGGSLSKADILINNLTGELRDFATNFKLAGKVETLPDGTTLVLKADNGDELGRIVNNKLEVTNEQIVKIQKGYRPKPSLYMSEADIASHLNKFESEGVVSRVVLKDAYKKYGIGKPDAGKTEFVSLKSDIDDLIITSNGDLDILSTTLGIPKEQIKGGLVRVDFKVTSTNKVYMPSGNEFGANPQWIPGGKLPTGQPEVIVKTEGLVKGVDYTVSDIIW